jgi:hypothetical protein
MDKKSLGVGAGFVVAPEESPDLYKVIIIVFAWADDYALLLVLCPQQLSLDLALPLSPLGPEACLL